MVETMPSLKESYCEVEKKKQKLYAIDNKEMFEKKMFDIDLKRASSELDPCGQGVSNSDDSLL